MKKLDKKQMIFLFFCLFLVSSKVVMVEYDDQKIQNNQLNFESNISNEFIKFENEDDKYLVIAISLVVIEITLIFLGCWHHYKRLPYLKKKR